MPTPWLTADELLDLTGRQRWSAQARALARMGIAYRLSAQGRPLVERAAVLSAPAPGAKRQRSGPDWARLRRAA